MCTGIDIVRAQLHVAAGEPLELTGRAPRRGHAVEIRLNAEDPERGFMPVARRRLALPRRRSGPGVRIDTFLEDGASCRRTTTRCSRSSSSGTSTATRRSRARSARCEETVIEGVPTTREFALGVIRSDEFASGHYSTSTLAELGAAVA